jgi:ABC-type transport system involved in cytochrome bd biosynthesis fused ATPase/permease subunit
MPGIDKRLFSRQTGRWVAISAIAGSATVVLNIALFAMVGWAIEGLRVGASIFSIGTLIGALTLIAGKGFSGWLERFAAAQAAADTKIAVRDTIYAHALRIGPAGWIVSAQANWSIPPSMAWTGWSSTIASTWRSSLLA